MIAIVATVLGAASVAAGVFLLRSSGTLDASLLDGTPFADFASAGLASAVVGAVLLAVAVVIVVVRVVSDRRASRGLSSVL